MTTLVASSASQTCGLVLITAVLLQTICVAVTFLYFTNEFEKLREAYSKSHLACLMGEDLGGFPRTLESRDDKERADGHDPCWQIKHHLPILIKKILLKNYRTDITSAVRGEISQRLPRLIDEKYGSNFPVLRTAAHVTGNNGNAFSSENKSVPRNALGHKLQTWESERGQSFLNNVDLQNGELIIQKTGFYYIYSQTYFRYQEPEPSAHSFGTKRVKQMVQYIYKVTSYPEPILLMKSAKTTCWSKTAEFGLHSIHQGGVFELKQRDRIFVSVSDRNLIDMDKEASFFGAFLIG
ncbi:tumor necrosis factor ligand superfamily member 10 [Lissotriton helveticus]